MAASKWRVRRTVASMAGLTALMGIPACLRAADSAPAAAAVTPTTRPVVAKPLSTQVTKGLGWLAKHQRADGGWSQGESTLDQYRQGEVGDQSNVADTCMATLALLRAGNTPSKGEYAANILGGVNFVSSQIEKASPEGLFITDIKGTRVQTKLGQYIDTFASALVLAEVKGAMPDTASRKRVVAALDKVMDKIEKNQKQDGRWVDAHDGWASALCQSVAIKAVNRAAVAGVEVSPQVLRRSQEFAARSFDAKSGAVAGDGSANVELYARASNLAEFQDAANTDADRKRDLDRRAAHASEQLRTAQAAATQPSANPQEVAAAKETIRHVEAELKDLGGQFSQIRENQVALQQAQAHVVDRLADKQFVAGFGSNGGEEFLSYLHIGESLAATGGDEFGTFDKAMTENLNRIQNEDGSWSGQHCITGRTFCTATALMVLTVDRSASLPSAPSVGAGK